MSTPKPKGSMSTYSALAEVWRLIRPRSLFDEGTLELGGMMLTCAARAYNIGLLVIANHDMSVVLGTRNPANFRRELRRNVGPGSTPSDTRSRFWNFSAC